MVAGSCRAAESCPRGVGASLSGRETRLSVADVGMGFETRVECCQAPGDLQLRMEALGLLLASEPWEVPAGN